VDKLGPVTVSLTKEQSDLVRQVVQQGEFASADDVVRQALLDWQTDRARRAEFDALRADIAEGLADAEAGRTVPFDAADIIERGRRQSENRARSA
jgi:antitoxin ParD1/3/4